MLNVAGIPNISFLSQLFLVLRVECSCMLVNLSSVIQVLEKFLIGAMFYA